MASRPQPASPAGAGTALNPKHAVPIILFLSLIHI